MPERLSPVPSEPRPEAEEPEEEQEALIEPRASFTRRNLLRGLGGAALYGAYRFGRDAIRDETFENLAAISRDVALPEHHTLTPNEDRPARTLWTRQPHPPKSHAVERREREHIQRFLRAVQLFEGHVRQEFNLNDSSTLLNAPPEQRARIRALLYHAQLPQRLLQIVDVIVSQERVTDVTLIVDAFEFAGAQGLVYDAFTEATRRDGRSVHFYRDPTYYRASVKDYLPQGQNICPEDIDPRNVGPRELRRLPDWRRDLQANSGWASQEREQLFRQLARHPGISQVARAHELRIVEYFSLLKAIHEEQQREQNGTERQERPEQIASRLIEMRDRFAEQILLGPETRNIFLFRGNDERGPLGTRNPHSFMRGKQDQPWSEIFSHTRIDPSRVRKFGTDNDHNAGTARLEILDALATSQGKTFAVFDTHGATQDLLVDAASLQGNMISARALAQALLHRVERTREARTLGEMVIVLDDCLSYNFHHNVIAEFKRAWRARPSPICALSEVTYPTFVSSGQRDSSTIDYAGNLSRILQAQIPTLERTHQLTGQNFLDAQAEAYTRLQDITFFSPEQSTEFGANSPSFAEDSRIV